MENREPCQVGNQAALSGLFHVPQGRLFGAGTAVNACNGIVDYGVYDLIGRPSEGRGCVPRSTELRPSFRISLRRQGNVQGVIPQMAAVGF